MDHETIRANVLMLRDQELPEPVHQQVLAHLAVCAECRSTAQRLERLGGVFSRVPLPQPSEAFVQRVMARLEPRGAQAWARIVRWWEAHQWTATIRWMPTMAGAAVAWALAVVLLQADVPIAMEPLLMAQTWEHPTAEWVLFSEWPGTDGVLSLMMEGQ